MNTKTKILSIGLLVGMLTLGGASYLIGSYANEYSRVEALEGEFISSSELASSYTLGSEFSLPSGKISYDGKTYNYNDYYLTYPDGKSYKKDNYTLNISGKYDCTLIYKNDNQSIYSHYEFVVNNNTYTLSSSASYAEFKDQLPTTHHPVSGVSFSLIDGDMFTYNQVLDIGEADLNEPVVTYHPYAHSVRGNPANANLPMEPNTVYDCADPNKPKVNPIDANGSVVRITDAYDPSIYVEVYIFYRLANAATGRMQQYCVAGASNQMLTGLEKSSSQGTGDRLISFEGESYRVYMGSDTKSFGTTLNTRTGDLFENRGPGQTKMPIGSTSDPNTAADVSNADDYGYSIYYEASTKKIYVKHINTILITDLDDGTIYGASPFKGFTTGEVTVSIYGIEYNEQIAKYDLAYLKGVSKLNVDSTSDTVKPQITLDNQNNNFNIAVNESFDLFEAEVTDVNYTGKLETLVYYEYGTSLQSQISVANGAFTPKKAGTYTVIYRAYDTFGNVGETSVTLYAITTKSGKIVDFEVDPLTNVEAGQEITLPTPRITTYNNTPIIKAKAIFEDGEVTEINSNSWKLFLKKVGDYEIVYEYGDGILFYTHSYTLRSTTSNKFYLEEINFPEYIIKDASYTLDNARVVKVASKELSYDEPIVYISEDGSGFNKTINPKDFSTQASSTVQFKYEYNGTEIKTSPVIAVKDVMFKSSLNKQLYFDNQNITTDATSSAIILSSNTSSGNATSKFINPLNFSSFQIKLDLRASTINAERFEIVLTDYTDKNNQFVVSFYTKNDVNYVSYNNEASFTISKSSYSLAYDVSTKTFSDSFDNEMILDGLFSTDRFYLSFRFFELSGISSIYINSINSQPFNSSPYDTKAGNIVPPSIENTRPIGAKVSLSFFYPDDVFSPYLERNYVIQVLYYEDFENGEGVAVKADDGTILDGGQNVLLDYTFTLEKVGVYQVSYSYDDQTYRNNTLNSRNVTETKLIYSVDDTPPTIILNNNYDSSTIVLAKLNSTHSVVGYKVSDDLDDNVKVDIYFNDPNGTFGKINNGKIKLTVKGDYRIYYYATDSSGNISTAFYTVRVQ